MSKETAAEAAAETARLSAPMMFSDVVKMAEILIAVPFSSWVILVLGCVFVGWLAKKFIVEGHIVIALLLTATLLLLFDAALREDRNPGTTLVLAVALAVVGTGAYKGLKEI
jgi:hypothetical protein